MIVDLHYILQTVLGRIVSYSPGRRKDDDRGVRRKQVEEAEGAQVYPALPVDGGSKTNWARGDKVL